MPRVPRSEWPSDEDDFEPDDLAPGARFGGELGRAFARASELAARRSRDKPHVREDLTDIRRDD